MNDGLDLHNAVLIHQLPVNLLRVGMQALADSISIPLKSVTPMKSDHWGVNLVLDTYSNFKKVILKGFLEVSNKMYLVYPVVTDLAVCGAGPTVDEATVKYMLKPFAPVVLVYPEKNNCNGTLARNYRAILFHPEIPEEVKKWTCIKLKSCANDNRALRITFFCRFCRQYDHTRHECNKVKLQNSSNVATQDSYVTSSSNIKSNGNSSLLNSSPKRFRKLETDQKEKQVYPQINEREFRIPEQTVASSCSFNFFKLIPPSSRKDIVHLKKFFLDDDILDKPYKAASRYPEGINKLLSVLEYMGKFNEKYTEKRSAEENKFIKWLALMTAKIKYLHLLNISKIEPQYTPALQEIRKAQIENVNTDPEHQGLAREKHCTEEKNLTNSQTTTNKSLKTLNTCISSIEDQYGEKNEILMEVVAHKPNIDRNPSRENNFHNSGACRNKNSKSFCQTDEKNEPKYSSGMKKCNSEVIPQKIHPQTIKQNKPIVRELEKPGTNLIDDIINNIYLTHNKNARQTELSAQNLKSPSPSVQKNNNFIHKDRHTLSLTKEQTDPHNIGSKQKFHLKASNEFSSPNPQSEPCFSIKNFPVVVKREPKESFLENATFENFDTMSNDHLKKKIKTEFNEEEEEKDIKKHHEANLTDVKPNLLPKDCKTGITDALKRKNTQYKFPDGLNSAIKRSKGILEPDRMKAFLIHVKRRKYPQKYAAIYAKDVSKVIEQLELIVNNYYLGRKRSASDDAQISWIMQLIKNLKKN